MLDLYAQDVDPTVARLCFDESPYQLLADAALPLPMQPGLCGKEDYEYRRHGTAVILLAYDLDRGHRYVQVGCPLGAQRTTRDYAEFMAWLTATHYPTVAKVQIVQDNLNTHTYGAFYEHLPCEQAHALKNKLDFHFTPKHASWLNMAELEFSALASQCLDRRLESIERLRHEVTTWVDARNHTGVRIHWTFTTQEARHKLRRHYQALNSCN